MAELRNDVAEADAARRRRKTVPPGPQAPGIALSTIRRAAQLGIVTWTSTPRGSSGRAGPTTTLRSTRPAAVRDRGRRGEARRARAGCGDADRAQPGAGRRGTGRQAGRPHARRLPQPGGRPRLQRRRRGHARRRARAGARDADAARKRHDEISFELAARGLSLKDLEAQVAAGASRSTTTWRSSTRGAMGRTRARSLLPCWRSPSSRNPGPRRCRFDRPSRSAT
jgi:hypothetical protein